MRKVLFLLLAPLLIVTLPCQATDHSGDDLMSIVCLPNKTATQSKITSLLGTPEKVEENSKRAWWYYSKGNTSMIICWNKRSELLEKVSFTCENDVKNAFDTNLSRRLRSGVTKITDALKLLGTPKDMTLKESTQEMHYAYQKNVLRLFFRDNTLVDFCLY